MTVKKKRFQSRFLQLNRRRGWHGRGALFLSWYCGLARRVMTETLRDVNHIWDNMTRKERHAWFVSADSATMAMALTGQGERVKSYSQPSPQSHSKDGVHWKSTLNGSVVRRLECSWTKDEDLQRRYKPFVTLSSITLIELYYQSEFFLCEKG
jgi:hypothetical protein